MYLSCTVVDGTIIRFEKCTYKKEKKELHLKNSEFLNLTQQLPKIINEMEECSDMERDFLGKLKW